MSASLFRLGLAAATRPWRFIAGWLAAALAAMAVAAASGGAFMDDYSMPGTEVQRATDLLIERFPEQSGTSAHIVVHSRAHSVPPAVLEDIITRVRAMEDVTAPGTPSVSPDGRTALIPVQYAVQLEHLVPNDVLRDLEAAAQPARDAGLVTEYGGQPIDMIFENGSSEALGFALAGLVLIIAFGSLVATGLPLAIAAAGVGVGMLLVTTLAAVVRVSTLAPTLAAMVGIGVGVDYALFIVSRHRKQLLAGSSVSLSIARSMQTAGRSVVFAGLTVLVAICGLALSGIRNFVTMGFATAIVVAVSMLAATTLLPALLGLAGDRVLRKSVRRSVAAGTYTPSVRTPLAARWGAQATRRPWPYLVGSILLLLTLAAPVLAMDLGQGDAGNEPPSKTNRRAYELVAASLGPGANGPLTVAVDLSGTQVDLSELSQRIQQTPNVVTVMPPVLNDRADAAVLTVIPATAPQDDRTTALVRTLRHDVLPPQAGVAGATAMYVDFNDRTEQNLPKVIGAVVLVSFLLLVVVFRSIVAPVKAAIMNLLSVGAAYGTIVALFQWGWGTSFLGFDEAVPVNAFVPMFMFAVLFGLSMDYEVFLLGRIREEWDRTHDRRASVLEGLAATGPVITSAALIMFAVFAGFALNDRMAVKMMGVGMATAILVDATIVRLVLVPSAMVLLGKWNWWMPAWLARVLPTRAPGLAERPDPERTPALR